MSFISDYFPGHLTVLEKLKELIGHLLKCSCLVWSDNEVHRTTSFSFSTFADTRMRGSLLLVSYVTLTRNTTTSTREPTQIYADAREYMTLRVAQFVLKIAKLCHIIGARGIPRLTVSVPDYGTWLNMKNNIC